MQDKSVELVTELIVHVEPGGLVTADGVLHALDVLVLATGFDPNAFIRLMAILGDNGRSLSDVWSERPTAYRLMAVPDMPNFFMIEGPFSPLGNLSLILVSEWQVDYIMKSIGLISERRIAMAPDPVVTDRVMTEYRNAARKTIWATGGCRS